MKSRFLVSLLVIAMAAALIGGGTMAWFTDSAESEDVTMTAGTLLIDIDNFNRVESDVLNIENLNPGDEYTYKFNVKNIGTKRFYYKGYLCYDDILGNTRVTFPDGKDYGTAPLSDVLELEISVGENIFYSGPIADYENKDSETGALIFGEAGPMMPGQSWPYTIKVTLPEGADNEYQGSQLKAAFVLLAKQIQDGAEYGDFVCPFDTTTPDPEA